MYSKEWQLIARSLSKALEAERYPDGRTEDPYWRNIKDNTERYGFVPTPFNDGLIRSFEIAARAVLLEAEPFKVKFIDAGCGAGTIFPIAAAVGFRRIFGLDLDPTTIAMAERMLKCLTGIIYPIQGQIINHNIVTFADFGNYDVIYTYQPLKPFSDEGKEFYRNMRISMRKGSVAILDINEQEFNDFANDSTFKVLDNPAAGEGVVKKTKGNEK